MTARHVATIGVIGGGQLGRMFALDAKRMGYDVLTLDPQERSPAGQVADEQIVAHYDDFAAIDELGRRSDVVTYEFENVAIDSVRRLERHGYHVAPSSAVLHVTQDRILEKQFVRRCGASTADFAAVNDTAELETALAQIGLPAIVKTARGGYDGKGQWLVQKPDEARSALEAARGAPLIYERKIDFACELSVVATRDEGGDFIAFPVCENTHDRGILAMTIAPARVDPVVAARAQEIAAAIGSGLGIVGTYCVEFFLTPEGELLVNEIAPRPHNSGHYTIDVTPCSQYEEHVRAICGLPLSPPRLLCAAVMMNILGTGAGDRLEGIAELLRDPSIVMHLYGKRHGVARRKMGHFTKLVDGPVDDVAIAQARKALQTLHWA